MLNLKINGQKVDKDENLLFKDFIHSLNKDLADHSQVVSAIKINGEFIDEQREVNYSMYSLGRIGEIDITTIDSIELAFEALVSARAYIRKIIPHCRKTGEQYKNNDILAAETGFLSLINSLDNLTNLILNAQSVLRGKFKGIHANDSSLRIAQVRLVSAIEELLPAKKMNDRIMLADVLCNELPEALQEMCDYGIPVLQRLRRNS
jgi:hypothetical protein